MGLDGSRQQEGSSSAWSIMLLSHPLCIILFYVLPPYFDNLSSDNNRVCLWPKIRLKKGHIKMQNFCTSVMWVSDYLFAFVLSVLPVNPLANDIFPYHPIIRNCSRISWFVRHGFYYWIFTALRIQSARTQHNVYHLMARARPLLHAPYRVGKYYSPKTVDLNDDAWAAWMRVIRKTN